MQLKSMNYLSLKKVAIRKGMYLINNISSFHFRLHFYLSIVILVNIRHCHYAIILSQDSAIFTPVFISIELSPHFRLQNLTLSPESLTFKISPDENYQIQIPKSINTSHQFYHIRTFFFSNWSLSAFIEHLRFSNPEKIFTFLYFFFVYSTLSYLFLFLSLSLSIFQKPINFYFRFYYLSIWRIIN